MTSLKGGKRSRAGCKPSVTTQITCDDAADMAVRRGTLRELRIQLLRALLELEARCRAALRDPAHAALEHVSFRWNRDVL